MVVASTSRRVRGKVVGSVAEKRMKALGVKMIVPLGEMSGAFEGVNASTFAVELGSHIQRIAPYDKPTWSVVDDGTREAVYMAASVIKRTLTSYSLCFEFFSCFPLGTHVHNYLKLSYVCGI